MDHLISGRRRIEDLWAKGTDYCLEKVAEAVRHKRMLHLDMDLTGKCMLKCFYCDRTPDRFSTVLKRRELTTNERKDLILQAKNLGAQTIEFPGAGEPLIDEGFWEIIDFINACNMISVVFTSGYHLSDKAIDRLYESNATLFIKHNHTNTRIQDQMVGVKGYGDIANRALQKLIERGFNKSTPTRLAIDMVVTPKFHDMEEVKNIFRWCRHNNVHSYITTLIPEGMADHRSKILERERCSKLIKEIQVMDAEEFGLFYKPSRPIAGGYRCRQVNIGLHVNLYGEVYDCNGLGRLLGHIRSNNLREIWESKYARYIRRDVQNGYCLLRERVWDGVETQGLDRKFEEYDKWKEQHGPDHIVASGLEQTDCHKNRR